MSESPVSETIARWDAFLHKLRARVDECLIEAEEGCARLLDANGLDPQPTSVAWMAIDNQVRELLEKLEQTWSQKVEPNLEESPALQVERAKGDAFKDVIEREKERVEIRIFGEAARKIMQQARIQLAREQKCRQCGAELEVRERFFRSHHIVCSYCANVNTFVPGSIVVAVEHFCCHALAREASYPLWEEWVSAERRMARSEAPENRVAAERALRAYFTAYLRKRIEIVPDHADNFEKDLKGKMAFFYQDYSSWRR